MNGGRGFCIASVYGRCLSVGRLRIRGELAIGAHLVPQTCSRRIVVVLTMMQSCASRQARGRPFSLLCSRASDAMFEYGVPPPRNVNRQSIGKEQRERE